MKNLLTFSTAFACLIAVGNFRADVVNAMTTERPSEIQFSNERLAFQEEPGELEAAL